jgi:cytochrome P450
MATPQPFSDIDPPHNQKYRRLLTQTLGKKGAKSFEEHARALMIELVEEVLPEGRCEFVSRIAQKLPIFVIMRWLDLPFEDRMELLEKADDIMGHPDPVLRKAGKQFVIDYVDTIVAERRKNPGQDFISVIANGEVDERPVTHEEARSMVANLVIGGLDTVRNMMCFFAIFLARNAEHRQALVADPSLIPAAVEELLRWIPNPNMSRSITQDTMFHGVQLRAGDMILMPLILSGRDDAAYEHASEVDFARGRQRTLTFGTGGHMCPGMNLATIELNLFLEEWLKRIPDFHIDPDHTPVTRGGIMLGVDELQLVWNA